MPPGASNESQPASAALGVAAQGWQAVDDLVRESATPIVTFVARAAESGLLLDGVEVTIADMDKRNPLQSGDVVPGQTRDGKLEMERDVFCAIVDRQKKPSVIFTCAGRSARVLPATREGSSFDVRLATCATLKVTCVDVWDRPLSGVRLTMSKTGYSRGKGLDALRPQTFLPTHEGAIAVGVSGTDGTADMGEVPAGEYCAWASHPTHVPVEGRWQCAHMLRVDDHAGGEECRMAPLVAVWAVVPRLGVITTRIRSVHDRVMFPRALDERLYRAGRELAACPASYDRTAFQSIARVCVWTEEVGTSAPEARVAWQAYDGSWEAVNLAFDRLEKVMEAGPQVCVSTRVPANPAMLTVRLRGADGSVVNGAPLRLRAVALPEDPERHPGDPVFVSLASGVTLPVMPGTWRVESAWTFQAQLSGQTVVECREAAAYAIDLQVDRVPREVRFVVPDNDRLYRSASVAVFEDGRYVAGCDMSSDQALSGELPLPVWLPEGQYRVDYRLAFEEMRTTRCVVGQAERCLVSLEVGP